jgi:hypothetical protein
VSSARIVETLDELEDVNARLGLRLEATPIEQLAFECGEEALRHCVVIGVSDRPHRGANTRLSTGVFQSSVLRGRELRAAATAAISSALCMLRSVPLGKYWRSSPLVFSLVPRCHGLCGSQK